MRQFQLVLKTLGLLEMDPSEPRLLTGPWESLRGDHGETVYESRINAEGQMPRIFRHDYPYPKGYIIAVAILVDL